jgi:putative ABC transport system ATP-binding protein
MPEQAIEIADLAFHWQGHAVPCLDIPRLVVATGERLFLHAPSGNGKSTLFNLIGGVLRPDCGHLRVRGHELLSLAQHARDR